MEQDRTIAIDLGASKIMVAVIDAQNNILIKRQIPTKTELGVEHAIDNILSLIEDLLRESNTAKEGLRVGVGLPGPIDRDAGMILDSPNLGWRNIPFRDMLADALSLPVAIDHDAKVAGMGEYHFGLGRGHRSMVYIVVGSGVGGAIIIDGEVYRGLHNFAGEVGHFTIDYDGNPGSSNIRGNSESFISGRAMALRYIAQAEKQGRAHDSNKIDGKYVYELAQKGDPLALSIIREAGQALGILVASLAMILDIDLFVIGSSVARVGDMLFEPARKIVYDYAFASVAQNIQIEASLLIDDASLLGAAYLARKL